MVRVQMMRWAGPALLAPAVLAASPAIAQSYQCRAPERVSVPRIARDGPVRDTRVTGYTLALSWSPEFCRLREDQPAHARQCSGRGGRFGFIVHGLWPEGTQGRWPQWCPTRERPAPRDVARNLCMTPSARLLAKEWAKHGSCMVRRPATYYTITRILYSSLRWPDFDRISREDDLTAGRIRTAFADANPYWERQHIGLKVNERGWLEEMRLCYGLDYMPTRCDPRRYGPKDSTPVKIWRGL